MLSRANLCLGYRSRLALVEGSNAIVTTLVQPAALTADSNVYCTAQLDELQQTPCHIQYYPVIVIIPSLSLPSRTQRKLSK